eukprot:CAMPEP_0198331172 /NCGR_PEP_ID=MMETSP1450-20131203/17406_1 /TAXON_ID=753684 ORGANISM="Madagascaria erythrocladiodes, Strain CCMP3234" /NCGR_SAMPLE_ID=MMETSP1450 /ASSEMBLY_ACC=CAM_ASM_001115 /LENGTH=180 /DNA_ID=CAMNT_0044035527 /DNA_START=38 /DNA_END=577 /DNA_ORIENTATION=-
MKDVDLMQRERATNAAELGGTWHAKWRQREVSIKALDGFDVLVQQEAFVKACARLVAIPEHGLVAKLHGVIMPSAELDQSPALVWQYASGGSLADRLYHSEQRLPSSAAVRLLSNVAIGLEVLHVNDVVHGNLSSSTIQLTAPPNERPLLVSYGMAPALLLLQQQKRARRRRGGDGVGGD